MKKTMIALAFLLAACGTAEVAEEVAAPAAPAPAPAPAPKPDPIKEPYAYGDDAELDALWDGCADGVDDDCEDLYWLSPVGSDYEAYALERVNEAAGLFPLNDQDITDAFGTAFFMDIVWSDMSAAEKAELCLGVEIFGADGAATIIVAEATTFDVKEVAEWLSKTCP
jgi:hypothetical protein